MRSLSSRLSAPDLANVGRPCDGGHGDNAKVVLTPEIIARLGKETDSKIAKELGCDRSTIRYHRGKLGIPRLPPQSRKGYGCGNKVIILPDWVYEKLGVISDTEIASQAGVSRALISQHRARLGILPCENGFKKCKQLPDWAFDLLGKTPDAEIAIQTKVCVVAVRRTRREAGIPNIYGKF